MNINSLVVAGAFVALASVTACGNIDSPGPVPSPFPENNTAPLNGRVIASEEEGGAALGDVLVTAERDGFTRTTMTNGSGEFAFDDLANGEWTLSLSRDGYLDKARVVYVGSEETVTVVIDPKPAEPIAEPIDEAAVARAPAVKTR